MADGAIDPRAASPADERGVIDPRRWLFAGELALDGRIRPIRGALAMSLLARRCGLHGVFVPAENATEAAVVDGVQAIGVRTLGEVVGALNGHVDPEAHPPVDVGALIRTAAPDVDFGDVRGQEAVKRAITVAAAGGHNLLMLGPAGSGKTMMAKALPGVLPALTGEEALEVTRIYSAVGLRPGDSDRGGLVTVRPVRTPHHTASAVAIIGGGATPKPGEISLAHRGVLFLDELAEFPRAVLDTLRQPLEDGVVTVARAHSSARFPSEFMLVAAMNPTPKGDMPSDAHGEREMRRYLGRLSRPLIDRIDIHVEAPAVAWKELSGRGGAPAGRRARRCASASRRRGRASAPARARRSTRRSPGGASTSSPRSRTTRRSCSARRSPSWG